jgi:hypothetical protein
MMAAGSGGDATNMCNAGETVSLPRATHEPRIERERERRDHDPEAAARLGVDIHEPKGTDHEDHGVIHDGRTMDALSPPVRHTSHPTTATSYVDQSLIVVNW